MIKAIFFDIDGTLVSFNTHAIPTSTINALIELKRKDIKIFIATGRPFFMIDNLDGLTFDAYITLNGGYCMTGNQEVIYKSQIPTVDINALIQYQKRKDKFPCMVSTEKEVFINYMDGNVNQVLKLINFSPPLVKDFRYISDIEIFQLMAFFDTDREKQVMKNVLPHCETTRWNPLFTDIVAKGNNKQTGMDKILEYYHIDLKDCMAFGDGGNDIPMLRHAEISVAMGNADSDVKQSASYITDSVDNNGIWNALKHFEII